MTTKKTSTRTPAPSGKELKRLAKIAVESYVLGWLTNLHDSLEEVSEQAMELQSKVVQLTERLSSNEKGMSESRRQEIEMVLRRLIAFNNKSRKEKEAFESVGIGWCSDEAGSQLASVDRALLLITRSKQRSTP